MRTICIAFFFKNLTLNLISATKSSEFTYILEIFEQELKCQSTKVGKNVELFQSRKKAFPPLNGTLHVHVH